MKNRMPRDAVHDNDSIPFLVPLHARHQPQIDNHDRAVIIWLRCIMSGQSFDNSLFGHNPSPPTARRAAAAGVLAGHPCLVVVRMLGELP